MERFKVFKNDEGIFRVQIQDPLIGPRWLTDTDLMTAILGSHRSKILNLPSAEAAQAVISQFLEKEAWIKELHRRQTAPPPPEVIPSDTFKPIT